jgi:hypothetical protein
MKRFAPVFCLVLVVGWLGTPAPASAQVFSGASVRVWVGAEHYGLGDVREWQRRERAEIRGQGVPVEITDGFPTRPGVRVDVATRFLGEHRVGLSAGFGSTGGRLHYADYSGEVRTDWVVSRRSFGVFLEQAAVERATWATFVTTHGTFDVARLRYDTSFRVGDAASREDVEFSAWSFSVEPELALEMRAFGPTFARVGAGFGYSFGGTLTLDGEPVGLSGSTSPLKLRWTGWRVGLTVGIDLGARDRTPRTDG